MTDPRTRTDARARTDTPARTRSDSRSTTAAGTLSTVSHTHPDTGRTFGGNFTFARGGAIAADGGNPDVAPEDEDDPDTLEDVEHTPPNESDDANRVFERGDEEGAPDADE